MRAALFRTRPAISLARVQGISEIQPFDDARSVDSELVKPQAERELVPVSSKAALIRDFSELSSCRHYLDAFRECLNTQGVIANVNGCHRPPASCLVSFRASS
jgi:hypothetical protein